MIVLEGNGKVTAEITTQAEAACTRQDCIAQYGISASAGSWAPGICHGFMSVMHWFLFVQRLFMYL